MAGRKMDEAAREARNAYYREWRKKNPEKVRAANEKYWIRKAEETAATDKEAGNNEQNTGG